MSKPDETSTSKPAATRVLEARIQAGAVHWSGARSITHITTDQAMRSALGTHILIADELSLHPAGLSLRVEGGTWIIPHARVETYRLG